MADIKVAVIGAGIAGLSAALRLAERGYKVTVYEQKPEIGGQFGAHDHDGDGHYHEHCYHMLLSWYNNFWQIAKDIGLSQDNDFEPRSTVSFMKAGTARILTLTNPGSPRYIFDNLISGVAPPPDIFLYAYSLIDLLSHRFAPGRLLEQYSVNGFMQSRPYASERSAELHHYSLAKIFASPSYLTSAASYQSLVKYSFRHPDPMMWILKGDSHRHFHVKLRDRLVALGCAVQEGRALTRVQFEKLSPSGELRVEKITMVPVQPDRDSVDSRPRCYMGLVANPGIRLRAGTDDDPEGVGYVILAVPPKGIEAIIPNSRSGDFNPMFGDFGGAGFGFADEGMSPWPKAKKSLPAVPKLKVEPMASVDLYFNKRLPGIPKEHVVLLDSEYGLTFIDNSRVWPGYTNTVLNVVASDFGTLANLSPDEQLDAILDELRRYISFDPEQDLEVEKTHFQPNLGAELFVNEVGGEQWRPRARTGIRNLFLAGDYCRTAIDVVTIEGAVVSGLEAARALQAQAVADGLGADDPRARPIPIVEPDSYSHFQMVALKLMLAPSAYVATWMSWLLEQLAPSPVGEPSSPFTASGAAGGDPMRLFVAAGKLLFAPWVMTADVVQSAWSTWTDLYRKPE